MTNRIQLLSGIPVPEIKRGAPSPYPFDEMNTTDKNVFAVPYNEGDDVEKIVNRLKGAQQRWKKANESRKDFKFLVAPTEIVDPMTGVKSKVVGVWRTA